MQENGKFANVDELWRDYNHLVIPYLLFVREEIAA
jgi:hypothetical protein